MSTTRQIFDALPSRYQAGKVTGTLSYYFSVGAEKWTVTLEPERCTTRAGRHTDNADCVLKCDPKLFEKMVLKGKTPGPLDIARGKIKTNSVELLAKLPEYFRMG